MYSEVTRKYRVLENGVFKNGRLAVVHLEEAPIPISKTHGILVFYVLMLYEVGGVLP